MPQIERLLGDIYDAAINGQLWAQVTASVAEACGAEKVMLSATDVLNPVYNFAAPHNIELMTVEEWRAGGYDAMEVELYRHWMTLADLRQPSNSDEVFGGPEGYARVAGPYYELLERSGIRRQMIAMFDKGDYRQAGIGLNNYDPFPPHSAQVLGRLVPHLRRALEIHRQLSSVRRENQQLYQALDVLATGVILLDTAHKVCYANPLAGQLLRQHGGISFQQRQLRLSQAAQSAKLNALIEGAVRTSLREASAQPGGVMGLPSAQAGQDLTLSVMPLSALAAYQELCHEQVAAALFISPSNAHHLLLERALVDLYRLSPREVELCRLFVNQPSLDSMATQLGISIHSVRTMMKSIFQKTGQDSQAKLVRLLMELRINFNHGYLALGPQAGLAGL